MKGEPDEEATLAQAKAAAMAALLPGAGDEDGLIGMEEDDDDVKQEGVKEEEEGELEEGETREDPPVKLRRQRRRLRLRPGQRCRRRLGRAAVGRGRRDGHSRCGVLQRPRVE